MHQLEAYDVFFNSALVNWSRFMFCVYYSQFIAVNHVCCLQVAAFKWLNPCNYLIPEQDSAQSKL